MSRHEARQELAVAFGATGIVPERGSPGVAALTAMFDGIGPDVVSGRVEPGRVFDLELPLEETPGAYAAMDERRAATAVTQCAKCRTATWLILIILM